MRLYAESPDSLTLELGSSRVLTAVLAALHGGAGALMLVVPLALAPRIALLALIALSLYRTVSVHGLRRSRDAVTALTLGGDDECALRRRGSTDWEPGRVVDRWVQPWVTLLTVRCENRRRPASVVICADAVAPDSFRRLRVRLRLGTAAVRG
jgi:toxin CptA